MSGGRRIWGGGMHLYPKIIHPQTNPSPNPPNKDVGEGLNTAFSAMRNMRLKDPIIEQKGNNVLVILKHESLGTPQELIVRYLESHETITNREAREICSIGSENSMKHILKRMVEAGMLETITGKTIKDNDTITISSEFNFTVDAKIMDMRLYDQNNEIDLTLPDGAASTNLGGLGFMRLYNVSSYNIEIENIGNVTINLSYGEEYGAKQSIVIEPIVKKQLSIQSFTTFIFDGGGTITDNDRIQLGNDGKGYFSLLIGFPENNDSTLILSYN